KAGSGSCAVVNNWRKMNLSSPGASRRFCRATYTVPAADARISSSRISIRALERWSAISFPTTAQIPVHGEPSRVRVRAGRSACAVAMTSGCCIVHLLLEIPGVDLVQIRDLDLQPLQPPTNRHRRFGGLRADVRSGLKHIPGRLEVLHVQHLGDAGQLRL